MRCGDGPARKERGAAWSSSCSRNAHARKVLVRRAHSRINQAAPQRGRQESGLGRMGREQPGALSCSRNPHDETVVVRRAQQRATWLLLPCGEDRRSIGVWIRADGCSRLASKKEKAPGTIIPFTAHLTNFPQDIKGGKYPIGLCGAQGAPSCDVLRAYEGPDISLEPGTNSKTQR